MPENEDRVRETLEEWEKAKSEENRIRSQYVATGSLRPGGTIKWPEKMLDANGLKEIEEATRQSQEKWNAHQDAIDDCWPGGRRVAQP